MLQLMAALTTGMALAFGALAVGRRRQPTEVAARVETLKGQFRAAPAEDQPFGDRIVLPAARGLGKFVVSLLPVGLLHRLNAALVAAGRPFTAQRFVTFQLAAALALGAIAWIALSSSASGGVAVIGAMAVFAAGLGAPLFLLRRRILRRRRDIWRSLPDTADLLTTCVEAGMSIDAGFARVAEEMPGQLAAEIHSMLWEVSLGRPRQEALMAVGDRTGVDDLQGMLSAIVQADQSGTALAPVLRAQSRHIRVQRRLRAEEVARTVPAKMTFPIILLIVPTLFIFILGPLGVELIRTFES